MSEEEKRDIISNWNQENYSIDEHVANKLNELTKAQNQFEATKVTGDYLQIFMGDTKFPATSASYKTVPNITWNHPVCTSLYTSEKQCVSFTESTITSTRSTSQKTINADESNKNFSFGVKETAIYISLFDDRCPQRSSGTQATAFINKCLQVPSSNQNTHLGITNLKMSANNPSSLSTTSRDTRRSERNTPYSDVYFFGRKKDLNNKSGMGTSRSKTKLQHNIDNKKPGNKTDSACCQAKSNSSSVTAQTKKTAGSSAATSTGKMVSIKDDRSEKVCPEICTKGDMVSTVSHIKIGPVEPCPVHGSDPCGSPKCIVASSGGEQAAVKITTVTNPRRGVFELVIRRMTGAPLAKNELMLEWTPPPSRPPPCGVPCPVPCIPPSCRPQKCKMIVCRPPSCRPKCCKTKCCKKPCKKPCGPIPCRSVPCKKCCRTSCCGKPCKPCPPPPRCRPCPPSPCSPCGPPCSPPCCSFPCSLPCKSSPCLRPCPVGRKKSRRCRSQPRIRPRIKRVSPCCNRASVCPVVRCRSVPGPCLGCCSGPCPPRKCCSVSPGKFFKPSCSSCCG